MLVKIMTLVNLFNKGESVADPAKWKTQQITANGLVAVLMAIVEVLRAFGVDVYVTDGQALAIGGGILAVFNVVYTVITSKKVGLSPKAPPAQ